jgi:protein-arginine kinase activator protein McsA|tara:strand:+ start:309 stop:530 length:222 start_codon:yes stop_codon:yes gene_type:complete
LSAAVSISAAKLSPDRSSSSGKPRRPPRPGRHLTMEMAEDLTESMHEEAARLRDEIKRMKKMDLEFAQDMMSS